MATKTTTTGKVSRLVRRLFRPRDDAHHAHLKLRRAVTHARPRQVAELLELGASPVWADDREPNALLLACQRGDAHVLNLLLDWFFPHRALLAEWGPPMYCTVVRAGHWDAFLRLQQRNVPQSSEGDDAKLPLPVFVAAESGRQQILAFLIRQQQPPRWREYAFGGHSLLSIASKHGHYECVEVLLANMVPTADTMDFALDCARKHRQAHVLVLLTSCLPEYNSAHPDAVFKPPHNLSSKHSSTSSGDCPMLCAPGRGPHRGSLAETDVMSECDENDLERRSSSSSAWLNASDDDARDPLLDYGMPFSNESDEAAYRRYDPNRETMDGFALLAAAREADARAKGRGSSERELQRQTSSGERTWDSSSPPLSSETEEDDERWYAPKLSEDLILPYIKSNTSTNSDASTDPFTDFDGTFHDADADADTTNTAAPESAPQQLLESLVVPTQQQQQQQYHPPPHQQKQQPQQQYQSPQQQPYVLPPPPAPVVQPLFPAPPVSHKVISIRSSNFRSYRTLPSIQEELHPAAEHE